MKMKMYEEFYWVVNRRAILTVRLKQRLETMLSVSYIIINLYISIVPHAGRVGDPELR